MSHDGMIGARREGAAPLTVRLRGPSLISDLLHAHSESKKEILRELVMIGRTELDVRLTVMQAPGDARVGIALRAVESR